MQIKISSDELTANVNGEELVVGGPIAFKNIDDKVVPGIILEFKTVDKKDLKSPWCYAKDLKTNNALWFSLHLWAAGRTVTKVEAVKNEIEDDELF